MKKRLKINAAIILCALLSVLVLPEIFFRNPGSLSLEIILKVFGLSSILLGQLLRVSARGFKAENSQESRLLIQGGPYAVSRNPMYLGIFLIGIGITLFLFKWWVGVIFLLFFSMRYLLLIFQEEKKLSQIFPQEYPGYCKRVPRIFPRLCVFLGREIREYLPLKLKWLKKEVGSISAVLLLAFAIAGWVEVTHSGAGIYFKEIAAFFVIIVSFLLLINYLKDGLSTKSKSN